MKSILHIILAIVFAITFAVFLLSSDKETRGIAPAVGFVGPLTRNFINSELGF